MPRSDRMEHQLAYLIASVNRQLEIDLEEKLKGEGVALEHFRILSALASQNGQPMGELAHRVLVDSTTLTKIIDKMTADALVYRAPDSNDRRRVLVFLASKGQALHKKLKGLAVQQERDILGTLDAEGAGKLEAILRTMIQG
ncbi:DNA-binding transcriptional regulator, MarR family [Enhydrobacter aerosaccus]|uniref:DNA-binding transcriptional regulator, MarR family n=1 Tax=Enhydrobacter aerosaccus TaxID=225324 RepID=A0A1T4TFR4_9HYPH|nr:MarR family transcriptional regulator [Enhydrobacter aerosaccus]SKA39296.1 DNA-binding transcriptional regulator, MarR family [Enhydrobacter aerosaccus]